MKLCKSAILSLAMTSSLFFGACSSADILDDSADTSTSKKVTFEVSIYEHIAMRAATEDAISQLSFALFPTNGGTPIEVTQEKSDDDFTTISTEIPYGNYELVVIGHNGEGAATVTAPDSITFPDGRITDTFCHYAEMEVTRETAPSHDIELKRCIAKLEVVAQDTVPAWLSKMGFAVKGGGVTLNARTGLARSMAIQTKTADVPSSFAGQTDKKFSISTFLTSEEDSIDLTLNALDADGKTRLIHNFTGAPMKINQITRYKGLLFSISKHMSGNITVDSEWDAINEHPF